MENALGLRVKPILSNRINCPSDQSTFSWKNYLFLFPGGDISSPSNFLLFYNIYLQTFGAVCTHINSISVFQNRFPEIVVLFVFPNFVKCISV